jgi:hypothetical protein
VGAEAMIFKVVKVGSKLILIAISMGLIPHTAAASAGYYPVKKGELLETEVCVPKNTKPPLSLQLTSGSSKAVSVSTINAIPKLTGSCPKDEIQVFMNWTVDRTGLYGISFYASKSKSSYVGWPDGIEVTNVSKKRSIPAMPADRTIVLPKLIGSNMYQIEEWKRINNLKLNLIFNTAVGYNYTISCRVQNKGVVLGQSYPPGAQVKDSYSTSIFLDISC